MRVRLAVVSAFLFLLVSLIHAAMLAAVLSGVVTDETGAVIPGVEVTVRAVDGATPAFTTTTGEDGRFSVMKLAPGTYEVAFTLNGFATERRTITIAKGGPPVVLSVALAVGQMAETVSISSEAPVIQASMTSVAPQSGRLPAGFNREEYRYTPENDFKRVSAHPLSTFSIDADTASYSNVRRFLNDDELPPDGAVRLEELINYFQFDYTTPRGDAPVGIVTEVSRCPWNDKHLLALVGVPQGAAAGVGRLDRGRRARNLVFLLDVSGSMSDARQAAAREEGHGACSSNSSTDDDRIAIVVYAGSERAGAALDPGDKQGRDPRGARAARRRAARTNGGEGIQLAYDDRAQAASSRGGINRVILATDGDFNVGMTSEDELVAPDRSEAQERRLPDGARRRHGQHQGRHDGEAGRQGERQLRVSRLAERGAQGAGATRCGATLVTVAKDVKIQVEFNPREGRGLSPDRLREPPARRSGLQRRREGRRRDGRGARA